MEDEILESTKSRARDLLMCNLCGGTYCDPRCLPCAHTFCRRCLQVYHDSIPNKGSVRLGSFHCPTCNALIGIPRGGVSDFPVDERIGDIKEKVIEEMQDILLKKLHTRKGMSDTGSSVDSSDTESQNSDSFSQRRTTGSHETDPPLRQSKSRSIGRYQTFTAFDSHQKKSETSNASSSESRFGRQRPAYSSLRETHRRKAQDLLATFGLDSSKTDEFVSGSSTPRETDYNASETSYHADNRAFTNSSRFQTHHSEDVPPHHFSRNSTSSFSSSKSARTSGDSAFSFTDTSSSGYFDDKNSTFLSNHRGYESMREKSRRRTFLGEDTFSHRSGNTAGESKFQETKQNLGDLYSRYTQENDRKSVRVVESDSPLETAAGLKSASERKPVSDPSCLGHAKKDLDNLGDVKFTDFKRPSETVAHTSDDSVNDQNGEIPESVSTSQPSFSRNENFARLKKPSSGRTKLLGSFISPLATAHEECLQDDKMTFEESASSKQTKNRTRFPADFTNTVTSNTNTPADLISSDVKSGTNEKQTFIEVVDKTTKVSGKVPLKNVNNSKSLEEVVEVMQEFDFLNDDDEIGLDETNLPELHPEQCGKSSCKTATQPPASASRQCTNDTEVADSAAIADRLTSKNGFAENGFSASHRGAGDVRPGNSVTAESSNGIEECLSQCTGTDPLPARDLFGNDEKVEGVASAKNLSNLHKEDDMKIHGDLNLSIATDEDDDDDEDEDTLVNGKESEEEDICFVQSPPVSSSVNGDHVKKPGQTCGSRRVTRRKRTVNKGTATLHHVSPEVYLMPTGVVILSQGSTVVADYGIGCLQYYAEDGSPLHRIEGLKPFSIAVNLTNNQVIVGDRRQKTVCLFDESGCDVAQWDANMFKWICGIGILKSGDLVILDREKSQIGIYKPNGQHVHMFGSYGNEDGQLCMAEFLVVDGMDRIVVSDSGNHCVKVFSVTGTLLLKFGTRGCYDGEMQWPKGICTDESNNIIVADTCNSRVSMFSSDGSFVQHLVTNIDMPYAVSYSNPNVAVTRYSVMGQSQFLLYSISNKS